MNTSFNPPLYSGLRVRGKWNAREYRIERPLGEGANGKVYLVSRNGALYAMKVGADPMDLQGEANVLKRLSGMDGAFRHFLVDVDDLPTGEKDYPFYIMQYVKGSQLQDYLEERGQDWLPVVGLRLLEKLSELHAKGYIFGDLKRENILVSPYGHVDLVDFGGVTPKDRAVKQFTEMYDRGWWNAGDRSADERYDLFSFAVLCVLSAGGPKGSFGKGVLPQNRSLDELLEEVRGDPALAVYAGFVCRALRGEIPTSRQAIREWKELLGRSSSHAQRPKEPGRRSKLSVQASFAASLLLFTGVVWYYW